MLKLQIISKFGFSIKKFDYSVWYSRSKIFILLLFLNKSYFYSLTICLQTKHLLLSSRSAPQVLHVLPSFPPYLKEIFFLGKVLILVESCNWKIKAKHMLSGKGIDTVWVVPFFVPTFTKRMTSLCKWSGCRPGNKSLLICMFCCMLFLRFPLGISSPLFGDLIDSSLISNNI